MPLIFVHGVSNRYNDDAYLENSEVRDAFLKLHVLPNLGLNGNNVQILNPYWGDVGVKFRWENASLPQAVDDIESFGAEISDESLRIGTDIILSTTPNAGDIATVAKRSLQEAIDIAWSSAMLSVATFEVATQLAISYKQASNYAAVNQKPAWLQQVTKGNFLDLLNYNVNIYYSDAISPKIRTDVQCESFGSTESIYEQLQEGLSRVASAGGALTSSALTSLLRNKIHLATSLFLGDIFQYLKTREKDDGTPGLIVEKVMASFLEAKSLITPDDPKIVIIGHSLGGVITYDILTYFAKSFEVDVFVTVGSQVALFEEMTLYKASQVGKPPNPPEEKLPRPANIKKWLNVFCLNDVFGFKASGVFEGVEDYQYDTGYGVLDAHSGYFKRPSFYVRLGERLAKFKL